MTEIEKSEVKVESFVSRGWSGGRKLKPLRMSSLSSSVLNEKWAVNLRKISIWGELSLERIMVILGILLMRK